MLRANSRLRTHLGPDGVKFLEHAAAAIQRILPHAVVSGWTERAWCNPGAVWTSPSRTEIRITFTIGRKDQIGCKALQASVRRRQVPGPQGKVGLVLDLREHDICKRIALQASGILELDPSAANATSLQAISSAFDERVVAEHIQQRHHLTLPVSGIFEALHELSEQSYENKSLTFGCLLDPALDASDSATRFPGDYLKTKKYKALSDGYRTAYHISKDGGVVGFVDLDRFGKKKLALTYYSPEWTESLAKASRKGRCGIALSRRGDLLVFDEGTLRFTYRFGRWQYWNHLHLVNLLRDRARAQRVPQRRLGYVVSEIYRTALDISFRRSGGLFVVLHNRKHLRKVVRAGDASADKSRDKADQEFNNALPQWLPRCVLVELASLDGAVVVNNSGTILAYGAVLRPKRAGRLRGSEGSRTKAAIGASHYGLTVKISSDGDITVYHKGKEFISV